MSCAGIVVLAVSSVTGRGGKHGWLPDDLNNGRLDLFFLFLAGLLMYLLISPHAFASVRVSTALPQVPGVLLTSSQVIMHLCFVLCNGVLL